ncbi:phosphate signaling complex protein PhoU [Halovenus sp. WSH3]|uniref:Phosphate-specific transport system accessory protein PhoU n=1 Tax=Halovenus carboxidivorans TaxID=2692199 RepID=A0A6B0T7F2_9EURY|nr:phosphate signaling complex protein PhoU [Halovenus carboxidivorans]MXR50820.1 phosphate signaling complex protein PhoU [Halovenus carboxidivorans]
MPRDGYQQRLEKLSDDILYMSELVIERLQMGLDALQDKDEDLAWEVIEGDHEINEMYLELEQECIDLIALQQPVAGDLRFIAASFKIITDLERIADLATNLGDYSLDAQKDTFPEVDIQAIGSKTIEMVEDAMEAYDTEDAEACIEIADRDDEIDELCEEASELVVRDLIERQDITAEEQIQETMQDVYRLLLTIRDLERVGDHAVNIAARTLYMVESDDELLY